MTAPAAAPIAVPMAALFTPLSVAAWDADTPPTWDSAYCLQSRSSARNWSKVLPVPGKAMMLGPVGIVVHAASRDRPSSGARRGILFIEFSFTDEEAFAAE